MGQLNSFVTLPVSHHTCLFSQYTPPFREGLGVGFPFFVVHRGVEPRFSEPKSGVIPIYEWTSLASELRVTRDCVTR